MACLTELLQVFYSEKKLVRAQTSTRAGRLPSLRSLRYGFQTLRARPLYVSATRGLDRLHWLRKISPQIHLRIDCHEHDAGPKFAEVLVPLVYELKDKGWVIEVEDDYLVDVPMSSRQLLTSIKLSRRKIGTAKSREEVLL
jgi:hypothetical protein